MRRLTRSLERNEVVQGGTRWYKVVHAYLHARLSGMRWWLDVAGSRSPGTKPENLVR